MAHQLDTVIVGTKYRGALAIQIVAGLPRGTVAEVTFEAIIAGSEIKFAPKIRVKLGDGNANSS